MWKLVIADDEPKIRRGIENILNWSEFGIEIVGQAEDGEIALEIIKENRPDIILLDINMPFLNGLDLLQKLKEIGNSGIVIIISGYDDFSYAQKALQYNVFDYILKPVSKKNIEEIIIKATNKLIEKGKENNYLEWVKRQLAENKEVLQKTFFSEWFNNKLSDEQVLKEMSFFDIEFGRNIGIMVIKIVEKLNVEVSVRNWSVELLEFAIANILNDGFKDLELKYIFNDDKKNIILVSKINDMGWWISIAKEMQKEIYKYLKCNVLIEQASVFNDVFKIKDEYMKIMNSVNEKKKCSSMVLLAIKYIEDNYYSNELSINYISNKLEVTSSYLSKLLKKETGLSFIDYLTKIRIKKAMYIMEDPAVKIYDVAELVGYSNQHYFCRAFKKVVGVSPTEYKRGR
ncbi:response regulator transcription factor [Clostridium beijerinckii]|uniref:response regulator transcription factor n=1 Tax=Clostridium beijerinckii TaxID=1520 RepID=UPI00098C6D81|nr:response regulator [Clostridium beijerinckii]MBA8932829.1 two-component system response regulator YesN [Clostridium beijerinckii]NRT37220.1 two-component system response regulator YesN [Clostridium beijerinckii]NRT43346.1 two-component system response regulator YesN [Clostridium beijerinckii]NRU37032.1 two-component system response regulator YesN [Clostridium beijerinckii]NRZ22664.1 two-component system response regulator YesN [Clostridium beijerinckii]